MSDSVVPPITLGRLLSVYVERANEIREAELSYDRARASDLWRFLHRETQALEIGDSASDFAQSILDRLQPALDAGAHLGMAISREAAVRLDEQFCQAAQMAVDEVKSLFELAVHDASPCPGEGVGGEAVPGGVGSTAGGAFDANRHADDRHVR